MTRIRRSPAWRSVFLSGAIICALALSAPAQTVPSVDLQNLVNGDDADTPPGPSMAVGSPLFWSFVVTNTGNVTLTAVTVTDSHSLAITCPKTALEPGESMTCTSSSTSLPCQRSSVGTVTADAGDTTVSDDDAVWYFGLETAVITLDKRTNGQDAPAPPGPAVRTGTTVSWTYLVTNPGNAALSGVAVSDDRKVAVSCPKTTLDPGESMVCTGNGTAEQGQYVNIGSVTGAPACGPTVTSTDTSHYLGVVPQIALEKLVNGEDADTPPGPSVDVGSMLLFTYVATNTGDVALTNVFVVDDRGLAVTCPKTALQPGESMTCTASSTAVAGPYTNLGTASGQALGATVTATDPASYDGIMPGDGCASGYWKKHTDSWPPTGYSPSQPVGSVFFNAAAFPSLSSATLRTAIGFSGGGGAAGAAKILLRAGVTALLNASHPAVSYPRTTASVISDVNAALSSQNRVVMLELAALLESDNNIGCPLN